MRRVKKSFLCIAQGATRDNNLELRGTMNQKKPTYLKRLPIARAREILFKVLGRSTGLIFLALTLHGLSLAYADSKRIAQLSSSNKFARAKAVVALGQAKDTGALINLKALYGHEPSKMVRLYILQAVSDIPGENKIQFLEKALSDPQSDIRLKAAQLLQLFDLTDSHPASTNALNDPDLRVRVACAVALKGESGKQTLLSLAQSDNLQVRSQAILGLSEIHSQGSDVKAVIREALSHSDPQVKSSARWAADVLGIEVAP